MIEIVKALIETAVAEARSIGASPADIATAMNRTIIARPSFFDSWFIERCVRNERACESASALYLDYCKWAEKQEGCRIESCQLFGRFLAKNGCLRRHTASGSLWYGLSLK